MSTWYFIMWIYHSWFNQSLIDEHLNYFQNVDKVLIVIDSCAYNFS